MKTLNASYQGLSLLVGLNKDRMIVVGTLIASLYAGVFIGLL